MGQRNVCPGLGAWALRLPPTPSPNLVLSYLVPLQPCLFLTPLSNYCCLCLLQALGCGCGAWWTPSLGDIWQGGLATVLAGSATVRQQVLSLLSASFLPPFRYMVCPRTEVTVPWGLWVPMAALQEGEIGFLALAAESGQGRGGGGVVRCSDAEAASGWKGSQAVKREGIGEVRVCPPLLSNIK